jgi:serine/threonine protein phosphatase PrpC
MMVLDGMGGHNKGDTASSLAMKIIKERLLKYKKFRSTFLLRQSLIRAIKRANREVNKLGSSLVDAGQRSMTLGRQMDELKSRATYFLGLENSVDLFR